VISIVAPSFRYSRERIIEEVAPLAVTAAREISYRMGYGEPDDQKNVFGDSTLV
jgi:hypothetical protein